MAARANCTNCRYYVEACVKGGKYVPAQCSLRKRAIEPGRNNCLGWKPVEPRKEAI